MNFTVLDWVIIVGYLVFALGVGLFFARRAGKNVEQFFLSGRSLPWGLPGVVGAFFVVRSPKLLR
jgi:Na+/proline symporter